MTDLFVYFRSPPTESTHPPRVHNAKEYDNNTNCKTRIQSRTKRHVVFFPPCGLPLPNLMVEDPAYDCPDREIESRSWGYPAQATKDDCEINFTPNALMVSPAKKPYTYGGHSTDQKAPNQWTIESFWPEEPSGADYTPENAAIEMDSRDRACKSVDGFRSANSWNEGKHPV